MTVLPVMAALRWLCALSDPLVLFAHTLPPIDCFSSRLAMLVCALSKESKDTALTIAADRGHDVVVRLLLQHGAKIDHQAYLVCIVLVASASVSCTGVLCLMNGLGCNVHF